jgi:hypothetical protein
LKASLTWGLPHVPPWHIFLCTFHPLPVSCFLTSLYVFFLSFTLPYFSWISAYISFTFPPLTCTLDIMFTS